MSNEKARAIFYLPQELCPHPAALAARGKRLRARNFDQRRRIRHRRAWLPPPPLCLPLPQVMYYECRLITQPRIPHPGWHVYLFVLYLFAALLYAKSFCDRLVYFLAPPRSDQTNESEEGRRAIDGQSTGRRAAGRYGRRPRLPHPHRIGSEENNSENACFQRRLRKSASAAGRGATEHGHMSRNET